MGTRTKNDHLAFETILAALFPDNAKDDGLMRALQELLGVDWDPLHRAELSNEKAGCPPASVLAPDLSHHLATSALVSPASPLILPPLLLILPLCASSLPV